MRTPFLVSGFILALLASTALPAQADELPTESHVEKVTVYTDRATITRLASIQIPTGEHVVVVSGLPAGLMMDSLRSEGNATADVTLGAVESRMISSAELAAPKERELNEKLETLQDQRALIVADQRALDSRQSFLKKFGDTAITRNNEEIGKTLTMKPDEWVNAAEKLYAATRDSLKTAEGYLVTLRKLDSEINAVREELSRLQTGQTQSVQVKVPVRASAATTLNLRVEYQIGGASWAPLYDARLNTASADVALTQYGDVTQSTGEDWANVELTLSTAQPARSTSAPPLSPYWINGYDPSNRGTFGTMTASVGASAESSFKLKAVREEDSAAVNAPAAMPVAQDARMEGARIETGGYVAKYHVPGLVTVTADSAPRKVLIQTMKTSAKMITQILPAMDQNAYLVARLKLEGETPLLPGKVNLFRDQAYIGSAYQGLLRAGNETDLAFGPDDQILVKRNTINEKQSEIGLVSKEISLDRLYSTDVTNLHKFPVEAEILEATPVSQNDKIRVTLNDKDTTPGFENDYKKIKGMKRWAYTLPAGGKQTVMLGWNVTYPSGWFVNGL